MHPVLAKLTGGDRRSTGRVDEVVADLLADEALVEVVLSGVLLDDPILRMRAMDALEKVSRDRPDWFVPFKRRLLDEIARIDQQEVQWHLAQILSHLPLTKAEARKAVKIVRHTFVSSQSRIARVMALEALCLLDRDHPSLNVGSDILLEEAFESPIPSVAARARQIKKRIGGTARR